MINKSLIINILTSAAVIVIGTLCVFYAEVLRFESKNELRFFFRCVMEK
jgi:ABC-type spermidine/putrescine transport system permease subunit II